MEARDIIVELTGLEPDAHARPDALAMARDRRAAPVEQVQRNRGRIALAVSGQGYLFGDYAVPVGPPIVTVRRAIARRGRSRREEHVFCCEGSRVDLFPDAVGRRR